MKGNEGQKKKKITFSPFLVVEKRYIEILVVEIEIDWETKNESKQSSQIS